MKFLIIPDLHGTVPPISSNDFDAILAVGDFCSDETKSLMYNSLQKQMDGDKDISWYDLCGKVKARKYIKQSLKSGRKVLEYLNSFNKPVFFVPGNWDWYGGDGNSNRTTGWDYIETDLFKPLLIGLKNLKDCHMKKRTFKGIDIIGYGLSSGPEEEDGEVSFLKLARKFEAAKNPVIFLSHNSPYKTPIDVVDYPPSPRHGDHVGSMVTRELIDEFQPTLCISGHMHEHRRKYKKRKTLCIATGFKKPIELEIKHKKYYVKFL